MTSLQELRRAGQSPWLDYIRRSLLDQGGLKRMVEREGITGLTANPTIFEKAIAESHDYDEALRTLLEGEPHLSPLELYERLAVEDITRAADVLRPVYDETGGADGFVSLEVAPGLAHDTNGTIAEAKRLWSLVNRPNLLVKVPGTPEGAAAIEQLLADGINVNVTLLFSVAQYEAVANAYVRAAARTASPAKLASVASFFVSRIDTAVDRRLDQSSDPAAKSLRGKVAIANCRVAYDRFRTLMHGHGAAPMTERGARPQRLLWASTSTKDPTYPDTIYVESLIGPETVDTIPPATVTAFEDHGVVRAGSLLTDLEGAKDVLGRLAAIGIDLAKITDELQIEGVAAFTASFATLLASLDTKKREIIQSELDPLAWRLGADEPRVAARLAEWQQSQAADRIWRGDSTFWPAASPSDVASRLGWLHLPELMLTQLPALLQFAEQVRGEGVRHVVVLGMGGSSLAPDVVRAMFGNRAGYPELLVLDSTHPEAVSRLRRAIDPQRSLFLVSSKSGTTTEPHSFYRYFSRELEVLGAAPGAHFVAITDPGTPLETLAQEQGFRTVFRALPTVGGRYSALTMFGLVPAVLTGVDVAALLDQAAAMSEACAPSVSAMQNPGLRLGAVLGEGARAGRDKLTFHASGGFAPFSAWVEQLIAESTGKVGTGIVPVVGEPLVPVPEYGSDRLFVVVQESGNADATLDAHANRLEEAGRPVVRIRIDDLRELGQEFFRWEFAVAAAGAVLGVNPFDQPDVEFAKQLARDAMAHPAAPGSAPGAPAVRCSDEAEMRSAVKELGAKVHPGDYVGVQAYLAPSKSTDAGLAGLRRQILAKWRVATTVGYGPRFLHSTGQLHKGGPNSGVFLQLVDTPSSDVEVPGEGYTFGALIRAQALGDLQALVQKGRRVLRVDLGTDVPGGLRKLTEALDG
ncbi:MAG TPA: bifunctional transaldolase/phosoglucose isomerase [Thermoplasmata archaeon]|nr:bifunctional transaldolase/phosoglucose isomerase [Thermoplasmata archaeon]